MGKHVTCAKHRKNVTTVGSVSVVIYHLITTEKCKLGNVKEVNRGIYRSRCVLVYFNDVITDRP